MKKMFFSMCFLALLAVVSCKKKKEEETPVPNVPIVGVDLNSHLSKMSEVDNPPSVVTPVQIGESLTSWSGTTFCKSTKYKLGPEYSEGFLLNPTTDVIYPGAIIDGNSINSGEYKLVSLPRTGGVISTDNINAKVASKAIDETVKSKVQQGIIDILNEELGGTGNSAQINFEIKDIYSAQQVDMELGFSVGILKNKIKSGFDFEKSGVKSRILVKFQQVYYTMTYDAKQRPAQYFQSGVTINDINNAVNGTFIAPVYVSNVKYGRLAFYSFESDMSQKDLSSKVNAAFSLLGVSGSMDLSLKTALSKSNTTVKGTIIGGSGSSAVQAISGIDGLYDYILDGGSFSASSPGLPIAYTLRRITDNGVFNVVNISEYVVNECYNTTGAIKLNSIRHIEGSQDDKLMGTVKVNLGYTSESFANAPTALWVQGGSFVSIPINGFTIPLANTSVYNLVYDPKKFDKAFVEITLDFTNRYDWVNVVLGNDMTGVTDATINRVYRVYLKDIKSGQLGSNWSVNNGSANGAVTYDLNVVSEGKQVPVVTVPFRAPATPANMRTYDNSKTPSRMYFNFSIDVENPLD